MYFDGMLHFTRMKQKPRELFFRSFDVIHKTCYWEWVFAQYCDIISCNMKHLGYAII